MKRFGVTFLIAAGVLGSRQLRAQQVEPIKVELVKVAQVTAKEPKQAQVDVKKLEELKLQLDGLKLQKVATKAGLRGVDSESPLTLLQATVSGTFWRNANWVKMLDLSGDQQRKMDEVFQQYRLKLVDLTATLQKEELILNPLFGTMPPTAENSGKIAVKIDRIADARAELEKANSKMLFGILQLLTPEQFAKLPVMPRKTALKDQLNLK